MAVDLGSARKWASELIAQHLQPGMAAVDATMGNGADTELIARLVGESGRVWAFDVQPSALDRTRDRLNDAGLIGRVQLILDSHDRMEAHVPSSIDAAIFNLGWLPGGDKRITTQFDTTLRALDAALRLLGPQGLLTACAYPGHDEGGRERDALIDWASHLDAATYQSRLTGYLNQPASAPLLVAVRRMR